MATAASPALEKKMARNPGAIGMKTGYTEAAGHCLISSASHNGREVIAVVLGDNKNIWNDSYKLLAFGLSSCGSCRVNS